MLPHALIRHLINGTWIATCSSEHARFTAALGNMADTQKRYLLDLLKRNAGTHFGQEYDFSQIRSVADFQAHVPIRDYNALTDSIEAISRGERRVLTADPVTRFQPTSGSSAATKLIPWTTALGREFRRGIFPWLVELYRRKPALLRGTAYWSLSPPTTTDRIRGRLPVGFEHDSGYLGYPGKILFPLVSAVPPGLARCRDMREFKKQTLISLLADENLSLISIWSPTFLTTLLDDLQNRRDEILDALSQIRGNGAHKRAEFLRCLLTEPTGQIPFERVWPNLQIISCWTHGPSELYAENLRRIFPNVEIQGKGLVATEAFVSLPFREGNDPVLAVTSHFFEFQDIAGGKLFLAHELVVGNIYRVIITTGGGLYRYPLGDLVRVTGFIKNAPCLRFIGREGNVSDLFGEKLQGAFVQEIIHRTLAEQGIKPQFVLMAPVAGTATKPAYTLFLETGEIPDTGLLKRKLENGLAENFHYAHCRRLGQLSEARVFQIKRGALSAETIFQQEMLSRGIKLGDIKMVPLDHQPVWERHFSGQFVS